jgi:hypothetical protein
MPNTATIGAGIGTIQGAGEATDGTASKAATGAITGAVTAIGAQGAVSAIPAIAKTTAARFTPSRATDIAYRRIAESFVRDEQNPAILMSRLERRFPEGKVADVGGESTLALLDEMANLPGKTRQAASSAVRNLQASRAGRLTEAGEKALGTEGKRLSGTLEQLTQEQAANATPLYNQLWRMSVNADDELIGILEAAKPAMATARRTAAYRREPFAIDETLDVGAGNAIPLKQLDQLKRSLYQMEQSAKDSTTGKATDESMAISDLRRSLIAKLDSMTTDQTGQSLYQQARSTFAGPAELKDAARLGSQFWSKPARELNDEVSGMTASELQAYRVGAMEQLRDKFGKMGGQTEVMKLWREPATAEKLRAVFPSDSAFRQFARSMAVENQMKRLESVVGGSQTARRLAQAEDTAGATATDLAEAGIDLGTGGVIGKAKAIAQLQKLWTRISTPAQVRDEIGRILLQDAKGALTPQHMKRITEIMKEMQTKKPSGAFGGMVAGL